MIRRRMPLHSGTKAFTLIELLVVISIISLLMSILLPVTSKAREQAYRVDCLSRVRQLTFAWNFYAMDNDDRLCGPDTEWNNPGHNWVADGPAWPGNNIGGTEAGMKDGVLWSYTFEVEKLYECRSARSNRSVNSRPERLRDYSISHTMGGSTGMGVRTFQISSEISRPAEKMVFTDADGGYSGATAGMQQFYWLSGSFWPLEIGLSPPRWHFERDRGVPYNIITIRHSEGCNLSFADFHCEYWRWKDRRTVKLAKDEITEDYASSSNADLEQMVHLLKGH